jgi:hypothetical protein
MAPGLEGDRQVIMIPCSIGAGFRVLTISSTTIAAAPVRIITTTKSAQPFTAVAIFYDDRSASNWSNNRQRPPAIECSIITAFNERPHLDSEAV